MQSGKCCWTLICSTCPSMYAVHVHVHVHVQYLYMCMVQDVIPESVNYKGLPYTHTLYTRVNYKCWL